MNKDKGKSSKPADKGKVKDLPSKKLNATQESSVKGGRAATKPGGDLLGGGRDRPKGLV